LMVRLHPKCPAAASAAHLEGHHVSALPHGLHLGLVCPVDLAVEDEAQRNDGVVEERKPA
jgi:hypothetical protein